VARIGPTDSRERVQVGDQKPRCGPLGSAAWTDSPRLDEAAREWYCNPIGTVLGCGDLTGITSPTRAQEM